MKTYEFTLCFALPSGKARPDDHLDALYRAGCDDAVVGVGAVGTIALLFTRQARSGRLAVKSAAADVLKAIPKAELIEAKPDLVSLAEIAGVLGFSRQNLQKYAAGRIRMVKARFPMPVVSGPTTLWRFSEVASWLAENTTIAPQQEVREVARAACELNLSAQTRRVSALRV